MKLTCAAVPVRLPLCGCIPVCSCIPYGWVAAWVDVVRCVYTYADIAISGLMCVYPCASVPVYRMAEWLGGWVLCGACMWMWSELNVD